MIYWVLWQWKKRKKKKNVRAVKEILFFCYCFFRLFKLNTYYLPLTSRPHTCTQFIIPKTCGNTDNRDTQRHRVSEQLSERASESVFRRREKKLLRKKNVEFLEGNEYRKKATITTTSGITQRSTDNNNNNNEIQVFVRTNLMIFMNEIFFVLIDLMVELSRQYVCA